MPYAGAWKGCCNVEINYQEVGLRIQNIRLSKKVTQEELAEAIQRSPVYISYIERGTRIPSLQTIVSIANALKTTSDVLLVDALETKPSDELSSFQALLSDCSSNKKRILFRAATSL